MWGWFGGGFGMVWEYFRDEFGPILKNTKTDFEKKKKKGRGDRKTKKTIKPYGENEPAQTRKYNKQETDKKPGTKKQNTLAIPRDHRAHDCPGYTYRACKLPHCSPQGRLDLSARAQ